MKSSLRNKSVSNSDTVKQVARSVRKWTERKYGQVDCKCAIASYEIFKRLKKKKIPALFCISQYHAYVRVGSLIVDVTADQFEGYLIKRKHKVLVRRLSAMPDITCWEDSIWDDRDSTDTLEGVRNLLHEWPTDQQPCFVKSTKL